MAYLISNIPQFKCWVRKEFTTNHQHGHGEYLHALAFAVNTIPDRSLSFQVVFTGCETDFEDYPDENVHGGAMWARMPIQALIADVPLSDWPQHKIDGEFYLGKYMFTVDYTEHSIADDPAQHKQSHVLYLTDAGEYTGNFVALPNNRVRATNPALWRTGEGPPDFSPSQWVHSAEAHESYTDPFITFDNLYASEEDKE